MGKQVRKPIKKQCWNQSSNWCLSLMIIWWASRKLRFTREFVKLTIISKLWTSRWIDRSLGRISGCSDLSTRVLSQILWWAEATKFVLKKFLSKSMTQDYLKRGDRSKNWIGEQQGLIACSEKTGAAFVELWWKKMVKIEKLNKHYNSVKNLSFCFVCSRMK